MNVRLMSLAFCVVLAAGCAHMPVETASGTFGDELRFLKEHVEVDVLGRGKARVAVVGAWQGRVMTSTAQGVGGQSFGWINRELIASGKVEPHINVFGGEDRFWLGPEGGQFSIFFEKDTPFDFEYWQTPALIDTEPFERVRKNSGGVTYRRRARLRNYSGTVFNIQIDRSVTMLDQTYIPKFLDTYIPEGVDVVAYESNNAVTNVGSEAWSKETGLLSIWILGMYNASPEVTVVVPFKEGPESELGPKVNADYFGKVPVDRLVVKDDVLFFKGDSQQRGKIGISPQRALPIMGSYDGTNNALTLVVYTDGKGNTDYVNSMWELQDEPYGGDVVNSYNDGPSEPGKKGLGAFYELETSSPVLELRPGQTLRHTHTTFHLVGPKEKLDMIARDKLGVSLRMIESAF